MVKIQNLKPEDIGRNITYVDGTGEKEFGHITSWNSKYVFVDYGPQCCGRGIATDPNNLAWG